MPPRGSVKISLMYTVLLRPMGRVIWHTFIERHPYCRVLQTANIRLDKLLYWSPPSRPQISPRSLFFSITMFCSRLSLLTKRIAHTNYPRRKSIGKNQKYILYNVDLYFTISHIDKNSFYSSITTYGNTSITFLLSLIFLWIFPFKINFPIQNKFSHSKWIFPFKMNFPIQNEFSNSKWIFPLKMNLLI